MRLLPRLELLRMWRQDSVSRLPRHRQPGCLSCQTGGSGCAHTTTAGVCQHVHNAGDCVLTPHAAACCSSRSGATTAAPRLQRSSRRHSTGWCSWAQHQWRSPCLSWSWSKCAGAGGRRGGAVPMGAQSGRMQQPLLHRGSLLPGVAGAARMLQAWPPAGFKTVCPCCCPGVWLCRRATW